MPPWLSSYSATLVSAPERWRSRAHIPAEAYDFLCATCGGTTRFAAQSATRHPVRDIPRLVVRRRGAGLTGDAPSGPSKMLRIFGHRKRLQPFFEAFLMFRKRLAFSICQPRSLCDRLPPLAALFALAPLRNHSLLLYRNQRKLYIYADSRKPIGVVELYYII